MVQQTLTLTSARRLRAKIQFDQSKRKIDAGGHAGRSPYRSVSDKDPVLFDPHIGSAGPNLAGTNPMGCCTPPVEKPCFRKDKRPVAGCSDPAAMRPRMADELDHLGRCILHARTYDDEVVRLRGKRLGQHLEAE